MSIFSNMKKWFMNPKQETKQNSWPGGHFDFKGWTSGPFNATDNSLNTNEEVFGVITRLANTLSSLPIHLYHNYQETQNDLTWLLRNQPNPSQTAFEFINQLEVSRNTYGNGYAFIERDKALKPKNLWLLDPQTVTVMRNTDDNSIWYSVSSVDPEFNFMVYNTEIIHVKHISTPPNVVGISPLQVLRGPLKFEKAVEDFSLNEMDKKDQYIIKYDRSIDPEKREAMIKDFVHMVKENGGAVVQEKGFEYEHYASDFHPGDLKDTEQITRARIANAFNVPVSFLNETNGNTVISEQTMIQFVKMTLLPIVRQYESEFNRKLLSGSQQHGHYYFKFNVNGLLRADTKSRTNFYQAMIRNGIASPNEVRMLEDLPPVDSKAANTIWVSKDLYPADNQYEAADQLSSSAGQDESDPSKGGEPDNDNSKDAEVPDNSSRNGQ